MRVKEIIISKTITVNATASQVWDALTNAELIKEWMAEPEMEMQIFTEWRVGGPFLIKGFHHVNFENKGTVLVFEPNEVLKYTYLSSLSRLPDIPENYTFVEFRLTSALQNQTSVHINLNNFPTETILTHVEFYWASTLKILKRVIEEKNRVRSVY